MNVSTLSCLLPVFACGVVSLSSPQAVVGPQDRTTGRSAPAVPLDLPAPERLLEMLRQAIRSGTPEQKEQALTLALELRAMRLVPEIIEAVADPTPLPRHGDTGWGFVGHQAASTLERLAHCHDGILIDERGRSSFSFSDDMYRGGTVLQQAGRLEEVRRNWRGWWEENRNCAG